MNCMRISLSLKYMTQNCCCLQNSFVSFIHLIILLVSHGASGGGVEACNRCAEGYLMEEWRCVPSCSAGFYATEPNPEIADGHRICRR